MPSPAGCFVALFGKLGTYRPQGVSLAVEVSDKAYGFLFPWVLQESLSVRIQDKAERYLSGAFTFINLVVKWLR